MEDFQGPKSSWRSPALRGIGLEQRPTAEILLAETHGTQPPSVNGVDDVRAIGDWHESRVPSTDSGGVVKTVLGGLPLRSARGDLDDALEGDDIWAISDGACRLKSHTEALCRSAGLAVI